MNAKNQQKNGIFKIINKEFNKWLTSGLYGGNRIEYINYKYNGVIYRRKIRYDNNNKRYIIINKNKFYLRKLI